MSSRCGQAEGELERLRQEADRLRQRLADAERGRADQDALLESLKEVIILSCLLHHSHLQWD